MTVDFPTNSLADMMNTPHEELPQLIGAIEAAVQAGQLLESSSVNLQRWMSAPEYSDYFDELAGLVRSSQWSRLDSLFWEIVDFGTGGRRGRMDRLGSATINARTIAESAHGLASYCRSFGKRDSGRAVVAFDTRHRSEEFARLTAEVLAGHGFLVHFFPLPRSTPELSFAVRHLACDVGAMISASHNPPSDNGFKAYWNHGGQVLAPHDRGIIDCVFEARVIPRLEFQSAVQSGRILVVDDSIDQAYCDAVVSRSLSSERGISALFTPLHGVGTSSVDRVLRQAGFDDVELFALQAEPDGSFPNVPDQLPNPERFEVFQPAIARAAESGAELILASDPDADRIACAIRDPDGGFIHLTGNQVGALLADYIIEHRRKAGSLSSEHFAVHTLVTTPLVGQIARAAGLRVVDDLLVGFKYIAQKIDELGPEYFVFGTEESLGYLAGDYCRDKDAAIAALYLMESAAELRSRGRTLLDRLDDLFLEHGYYHETQRSRVCHGPSGRQQIFQIMQAFRQSPPESLAGLPLVLVKDFEQHEIRRLPANEMVAELKEPQGNLLRFESESGPLELQFAARPSGTEPKIKFYFFARQNVDRPEELAETRSRTAAWLDDAAVQVMEWIDTVLGKNAAQ